MLDSLVQEISLVKTAVRRGLCNKKQFEVEIGNLASPRLADHPIHGAHLVWGGGAGAGLLLALLPGEHGHGDRLQTAGVGRRLPHPQPAPARHRGQGARLQHQPGGRQADGGDGGGGLHLIQQS